MRCLVRGLLEAEAGAARREPTLLCREADAKSRTGPTEASRRRPAGEGHTVHVCKPVQLHPADRGRVERVAPRLQENQVVGDPLVSAPRMYVTVRERDAWRARLPLHSRGSRSV